MTPTHFLPLRVYYEDTDAGEIVYYANYLRYAERGRTEWLRAHGFTNSDLKAKCGILIVVKAVEIDYKKPARLDESLVLETTLESFGVTSMTMRQVLRRDDSDLCVMKIVLVCVSAASARPVRWPATLLQAFGDTNNK